MRSLGPPHPIRFVCGARRPRSVLCTLLHVGCWLGGRTENMQCEARAGMYTMPKCCDGSLPGPEYCTSEPGDCSKEPCNPVCEPGFTKTRHTKTSDAGAAPCWRCSADNGTDWHDGGPYWDPTGQPVGSLSEQGLEVRTYGPRPGVCADDTAAAVSSGCLPDPIWDEDFGRMMYKVMGLVVVAGVLCVAYSGFITSGCGIIECVLACVSCSTCGKSSKKHHAAQDRGEGSRGDVVDFVLY